MNNTWHSFLAEHGACFDNSAQLQFSPAREETRAAAENTVMADLSQLALIKVIGVDAQDFLLSQFTNDVRAVDSGHSQISAYCTPKGRMLAIFRLFMRKDQYYLLLPRELRENIIGRLRIYVLRAQVSLELADDFVVIGLSGPSSASVIQAHLGEPPADVDDAVHLQDITVLRIPGPKNRYLLCGDIEDMKSLWTRLESELIPVGAAAWSWLDIMAGIPTVLSTTSEAFIPQMANLDILKAIDFKKGCYPGQEIVARMQYLGKLKQRMIRAHVDDNNLPLAGDSLYAPAFGDQVAGTIVDAQAAPGGGFDLLAIVQNQARTSTEIAIGAASGSRLSLKALPYNLPETTDK